MTVPRDVRTSTSVAPSLLSLRGSLRTNSVAASVVRAESTAACRMGVNVAWKSWSAICRTSVSTFSRSSAELMSWSAFTKANARAQTSWICSEMLLEFASLPGLVVVIFCILTHHYIQPGQFCPDPA